MSYEKKGKMAPPENGAVMVKLRRPTASSVKDQSVGYLSFCNDVNIGKLGAGLHASRENLSHMSRSWYGEMSGGQKAFTTKPHSFHRYDMMPD